MLETRLEFAPDRDREIFSAIPVAPAVFCLRSHDSAAEPYVSKTANLRRRIERLLSVPEERSKRLNLRDRVAVIEYSLTGSDFESGFLLYRILREAFPRTYEQRLHLRFAPLVKLHLDNEYPRASITTRLGRTGGKNIYYGPFPSRTAAEKFMNDALDFFKMRRCVEDLHPDPAFPGCVYSEMKMCLAPCFKGCTDDEYRKEVIRVEDFMNTRGESLKRMISQDRDRASEELAFEEAAALHARLEKLTPVLQQLPEEVQRIDCMQALIIQSSTVPESVAFFRLDSGTIAGPLAFPVSSPEHAKSQSMEARIHEALRQFPAPNPRSAAERMEHLAILKRWCYRGTRKGEIFSANSKGELPMRHIVRGVGRVFKGENASPGSGAVAEPLGDGPTRP
ncbi:MAG TPA: hypothetical protein VMI10_26320 [Terriglobales bacterium]|nr:hypothetical protein [Terriglobales bacterium]